MNDSRMDELFKNPGQIDANGEYQLSDTEKGFLAEIVYNQITSRSQFMSQWMDPRRDIDKECGYPKNITKELYKRMYDREPIAARVVEIMPQESWQQTPSVYEGEDSEDQTTFELAWDGLAKSLFGDSWYKQEENNPVWEYLCRADILSGVGCFGVILLGVDDGGELNQPLPGFEDNITTLNVWNEVEKKYEVKELEKVEKPEGEYSGTEEVQTERKLLYIRTFDESLVDITQYNADKNDIRFGHPVMYNITLNDPTKAHTGIGLSTATLNVHWSRLIHLADNLGSSEIFGSPRMECVWDRLLDLRKLYGGSSEMYWRGAFPGFSFETQPQLADDAAAKVDLEAAKAAFERYTNSLQRGIFSQGLTVKSITPQVVDPTPQINTTLQAICIYLGIPERIFMGSERGELASSQDSNTWSMRLDFRRRNYLTPRVIIPFIDRLIKIGVLPEPLEGYCVKWPDPKMSLQQRIEIALKMVDAIVKYLQGGGDSLISPHDLLVRLFGFSSEEATAILQRTKEHMEEANPDAEPGTLVPGKTPEVPVEEEPIKMKEGEALMTKDGSKLAHLPTHKPVRKEDK